MATYVYDILGADALDAFLAERDELVMLDFWAERCGPCRVLGPILHELADEYKGKVVVAKIDVDADENQSLAERFAVTSIPQVTMVQHEEVVDQFVGAWPVEKIKQIIDTHLAPKPATE